MFAIRLFFVLLAVAAASCKSTKEQPPAPSATPPQGSGSATAADPALGRVTFEVSEGSPAARAHFARGMAALHSFWYDEAQKQFDAAIREDATMNMAYWGAAMSRCKLFWHDDDVATAQALLGRMPAPDRLTPRERAWVQATSALLGEPQPLASRKRFVAAMERLHAQFPDDESATFLALALISATQSHDPDNTAIRRRAGALAREVFQRTADHPGAAHYWIHAFDTPELAAEALPAAQAYAKIAPAAFHAQHMPAHIFSRLGMWKEAIASCRSAWEASLAAAKRENLSAEHHDLHSLNWVVEMNFELGHRKDADAALKLYADTVRGGLSHQLRGQYALQVTSYLNRTQEWTRVDELLAPLDTPATDAARAASANTASSVASPTPSHCAPAPASSPTALIEQLSVTDARARAAAARRDVAATKQHITALDGVLEQLYPVFAASQPPEGFAKIKAYDERRRRMLLARAAGDDRALLAVLHESAAVADKEAPGAENNPVGTLVHEDIGDTLMRLRRPKEAIAEYALVLKRQPRRARALLGAARAATKAGDRVAARTHYEQLLELWATADEGTPGLAEARAAVAARP